MHAAAPARSLPLPSGPGATACAWALALVSAIVPLAPVRAEVSASPDVGVDLSGTAVFDDEVAIDDLGGAILLETLGGLPIGTDVDAYHLDAGAAVLFSTDTTVSLGGAVTAAPEDVIRHAGGSYTVEFDGSAEGVPAGAKVDAVTRDAAGHLVLSFDTTVNVGVVADDEDLVHFDGASFTVALDTSALAVSPPFDGALDVDAVDARPGGVLALSFDASGSAGGVVFDDEDVVLVDPAAPSVAMDFDGSSFHAGWPAADLDAVVLPEPGALASLAAGVPLLAGLFRRRPSRSPDRRGAEDVVAAGSRS